MKILLLGASGRTGRLVLNYALSQDHAVVALVRHPEKITVSSSMLTVIHGTPESADDILRAMRSCDAVVITLNNSRQSDWPWAEPVSPPHFLETVIGNVLPEMARQNLRRLMVMSARGVGDSSRYESWLNRALVSRSNVRIAYADHDAVAKRLRTAAGLDWTEIRPVLLTNRNLERPVTVSYDNRPKPGMKISRQAVARYLIDNLRNAALYGRAPVLSQK